MEERPRIGVGVIVRRDGKVLVGKRLRSHGEGTWSFPGGHVEHGEDLADCAAREVDEEAGIAIQDIDIATVTNDRFPGGKHYVTVFAVADHAAGEPVAGESLAGWRWVDWDDLPEPLFLPIENLLNSGFDPFA